MDSLAREDILLQLPQMNGRLSDEKILKFLTSLYHLYFSFPQRRFTLDNLTVRERQCISEYSAPSFINLYRRLRSRRNIDFFHQIRSEREFLSALVFLRLQFVPLCYAINEEPWYPLRKWIEKSLEVEIVMRAIIRHNYEIGKYEGSSNEEGPSDHSWWSRRILEDEEARRSYPPRWTNIDLFGVIEREEYTLTD